jgi:hypothetical protein
VYVTGFGDDRGNRYRILEGIVTLPYVAVGVIAQNAQPSVPNSQAHRSGVEGLGPDHPDIQVLAEIWVLKDRDRKVRRYPIRCDLRRSHAANPGGVPFRVAEPDKGAVLVCRVAG